MEDQDILYAPYVPATEIVAYTYGMQGGTNGTQPATVCPDCIKDIVVPFYRLDDLDRPTEAVLEEAAAVAGIDRGREASFDSREFPKRLYASDIIRGGDYDYCYVCLRSL